MLLNESQQLGWIYNLYQLGQSGAFEDSSIQIFEQILRHIVDGFSADAGSLAFIKAKTAVA